MLRRFTTQYAALADRIEQAIATTPRAIVIAEGSEATFSPLIQSTETKAVTAQPPVTPGVFRWLHLSDLHCDSKKARSPQEISRDVNKLIQLYGPIDAVIVTGDLGYSGVDAELQRAGEFLFSLRHNIADRQRYWPPLLVVPGNHDSDRRFANEFLGRDERWVLDAATRRSFFSNAPDPFRDNVWRRFHPYETWRRRIESLGGNQQGLLPGDFAATLNVKGLRVGVVGLNDSFHSYRGAESNGADIDVFQIHRACGDAESWAARHDLRILLTHHPLSMLRAATQKQFYSDIASAGWFDIHLCGSMHEQLQAPSLQRTGVPGRVFFTCQAPAYDARQESQGYLVGEVQISPSGQTLRLWPRAESRGMLFADPKMSLNVDQAIVLHKGRPLIAEDAQANGMPELHSEDWTVSKTRAVFERYVSEYEQILTSKPPGNERTGLMHVLVQNVQDEARRVHIGAAEVSRLHRLGRDSTRVVALACCIGVPTVAPIPVIVDGILAPRTSFERYTAVFAADAVTRNASPLISEPCVEAILRYLLSH